MKQTSRAGFSPGAVEGSPEAIVEQPPLASPPAWVLRHDVFLSHAYPKGVQGVPDAREVADAIQDVGVLPGRLRLRQFRGRAFPARARPGRVILVHPGKDITVPALTR